MNNKDINRSRRGFLEFLGKSGIAGPALKTSSVLAGVLANRYAQASGGTKRVVFVYTPMGAPLGTWLPTNGELNAATQAYEGLQPLCHFREVYVENGGFGLMWKTLAEVRFDADWTSDTIDHQIGRVLGITTPFPTLHLGVQCISSGEFERFSRQNTQPVISMDDPRLAYDHLFGAVDGAAPSHFDAVGRKARVLDAHLQSLSCSYNKLSSDERNSIEQYAASLDRLKLELTQVDPAQCHRPAMSVADIAAGAALGTAGSFAREAYVQAEIITHALACGLTNVATLQLSDQQGTSVANDFEGASSVHQASCGGGGNADYIAMVNHLSGCVAYLIKQLTERDDPAVPGTKLIDNTVVLQVTCLGDGPTHSASHAPNLLATRMPTFKTGLATAYQDESFSNLKVLQSVAVGLGLEQYIGKDSHHCIWPCGESSAGTSGVDPALLA